MRARIDRACDRYIEWCDYLSDATWHRWGVVLAPIMRTCEWISQRVR